MREVSFVTCVWHLFKGNSWFYLSQQNRTDLFVRHCSKTHKKKPVSDFFFFGHCLNKIFQTLYNYVACIEAYMHILVLVTLIIFTGKDSISCIKMKFLFLRLVFVQFSANFVWRWCGMHWREIAEFFCLSKNHGNLSV